MNGELRDCSRCVYYSGDHCSKWECIGTTTVNDIKTNILSDVSMIMRNHSNAYKQRWFKDKDVMDHKIYLALKECIRDVEKLNEQNIYD